MFIEFTNTLGNSLFLKPSAVKAIEMLTPHAGEPCTLIHLSGKENILVQEHVDTVKAKLDQYT